MSIGTTEKSFEIFQDGNELLIVLKGRIVLEELDALKHSVLPRIVKGLTSVYVDLKPVEYIDSAGLGLIIGFKMTSKMNGASIALMDPNKTVGDVLSISKIDGIFEILKGAEAQVVRDRLVSSRNQQAAVDNSSNAHFTEDSSIAVISSDGAFHLTDEDSTQKREQIDNFCRRAVEFMRQGDYENSIECYKGALELDPEYLPALNNIAIVYEKQPIWHNLAKEKWNKVMEISRQRGDEKHLNRAERHLSDLSR